MNFVGADLHKKSITLCVMDEKLKVLARKTVGCDQTDQIVEFFQQFRPFKLAVEATASYLWFVELVRPLAEEIVLANPSKLRVIAESIKKTDRLDAQILAEFLARDQIPRAYMPTPRQREHRTLIRHRQYVRERMSSVRCKIRHILADYNADRKDLFSAKAGWNYIKGIKLNDAYAFVIKQLWTEWEEHQVRLLKLTGKIKAFVAKAPRKEAEARQIVKSAPGVGEVTTEVVLSEIGDVSRFRNAKTISAYAGLVPRVRQTGNKKSLDLPITKQGSALLRWALVQAAWRLVGTSPQWSAFFGRLRKRKGSKRAIVAVARKLLCVLYAMLKTSTPYRIIASEPRPPEPAKATRLRLVRKSTTETSPAAETKVPSTRKRPARASTAKSTVTT